MSLKMMGKVTIRADGQAFKSYPGASIDFGGVERTPKVGHDIHGFSETPKEGTVEFEMDLAPSTSLAAIAAMDDVTMVAESDTGQMYVGRNWWCAEPPTFTDGSDSKVKCKFQGRPMEELGNG